MEAKRQNHFLGLGRYRREGIWLHKLQRWLYFVCKRLLDILVAAIVLILLAPLMLVIAMLVKLDSPGPVIFKQERVGAKRRANGYQEFWEIKPFTICKFRSMRQGADPELHRAFVQAFIHDDHKGMAELQDVCKNGSDEPRLAFAQAFVGKDQGENGENGQVRKLMHDPRVTRLGQFLRKSSLDELPQLWNVIKGDMSLVGPRPPISYEVDEYKPWHRQRLETVPGVTGMWQVSARSSADFDEMVQLDIWYVEHQSLWLDLKVLIQTPFAVLSKKGAV